MKTETIVPKYLLEKSVYFDNELAWPYLIIPAIIEAGRSFGATSLGGDLQFRLPDGRRCESMNVGVCVYEHEISHVDISGAADASAKVALDKFSSLGGVAEFIREGMDGFPDILRPLINEHNGLEPYIYFTWKFQTLD